MDMKLGSVTLKKITQAEDVSECMLKEILGPGRKKVKADWRKLHKEELHDLYC
jgi:hypothetical protein